MVYVVLYTPGPNWLPGQGVYNQPLEEHGHYMQRLYDQGKLLLGGPFIDDSGGMAVIEVAGEAEAQRAVADDPAVRDGIFSATIHPWHRVFDRSAGRSLTTADGERWGPQAPRPGTCSAGAAEA